MEALEGNCGTGAQVRLITPQGHVNASCSANELKYTCLPAAERGRKQPTMLAEDYFIWLELDGGMEEFRR